MPSRRSAYLVIAHDVTGGIPVFKGFIVAGAPWQRLTLSHGNTLYADVLSVSGEDYASAERTLVETALSLWPWMRPHLERIGAADPGRYHLVGSSS